MPILTVYTEQFSKYANLFFLFTALIQQIPGVSPTNRWTTIAPLAVVLLASAFKETQEDIVSIMDLDLVSLAEWDGSVASRPHYTP